MNQASASNAGTVVWWFHDGKPGHDNQSLGLIDALRELTDVTTHTCPLIGSAAALRAWLRKRYPQGNALPRPDLLIGAGHATHLPMLAARRACGGRIIVLMKPSLPLSWFDLCLIPEHDRVPPGKHVIVTRGALNTVRAGQHKQRDRGVILIGGPSAHAHWSDADIVDQVVDLCALDRGRHWLLTTSRRTPESFLPLLQQQRPAQLEIAPFAATARGWLGEQLQHASVAWISEDSVSMIYEALTAGCACGVMTLAIKPGSRLERALGKLRDSGLVTTLSQLRQGQAPVPPAQTFNEAARCATEIDQRWLHPEN